ncbi:endo alpha-1,4 polygalactosaminidase [Streptomyces salyersiae]|uniref:Endo alpha-1,4 polygalactosaminidase n=1 Tax=Streptomyces salyersiae TaxID=3075530 RepID=A0ABU2RDS5_9ACTN|nr:endo alpha-1,4 polygalactosaminidase [Streptomyces sp. DSM 41770]MDT0427027.1 endo alpha-1,4 polygalactosaminidase [Streptomyces sp. DSM 41770]
MTAGARPGRAYRLLAAALVAAALSGCSAGDGTGRKEAADSPAAPPSARPSPGAPREDGGGDAGDGGEGGPASGAATTAPATTPGGTPGGRSPRPSSPDRWRPRPGLAWQWQLDGKVDPSVDVPVYDIDGFENSAADVSRLHADGRKVICYLNAGAWEDFRPDQGSFPRSVLGEANGWDGERWLDIRRLDVLRPIMERRVEMCRDKGFDAVEPDLLEGYANRTGFPLTGADQLAYNRMFAEITHERGLSVGLKNDLSQIPQLVGDFDFAVNEECAQYDECERLKPFVAAGKAVFHVEYEERTEDFCAESRALRLSSMRKRLDLDVWRDPC